MFLQPDWFDVMQPGVGTNRFTYSFNDPINKADQNGNQTVGSFSNNDFLSLFWGSFTTSSGGKASSAQASETASALGWQTGQSILTSPLRIGEEVVSGYDYVQQNTDLGNILLPDRAAAMSGDPLAIAGMVPIGKWAGIAAKGGGLAETTAHFQKLAKNAVEQVGTGKGAVHGTKVHSVWGNAVRDSGLATKEVSYKNGGIVAHGQKGSIRCDAVCGNPKQPTAIYDLKTGAAQLTPQRIEQIRRHLPLGYQNIPIIEIRP